MKKLRVALTVLFSLTCSLFLFACGGNNNVPKQIVEINVTGQKTAFAEGEDFEMGASAVVKVIYQGSDEEITLTAEQYDVDSSAYRSDEAGEYTIIVTPKNQPEDSMPVGYDYSVIVEHNFEDKGNGLAECVGCKATRQTLTGLTTKITTVAWGSVAELDQGTNGYPEAKAPAAGEHHVSLGTLIKGQSVMFTMKIDEVDTSAVWNTPLMGIRNGSDGVLPREDIWVIGTAAGFTSPFAPGGTGATGGTAAANSTLWEVFGTGSSWTAADIVDGTIKLTYDYQMNDIFMIRHELSGKKNLTYTYTLRVPDASYELVGYGEKVTYTITDSAFTAGRTVTSFDATNPANAVQPEGKMFDTTGITTTAKFSKGDDVQGVGNFYAYVGEGEDQRKVNLGNEPLIAGMYDFCVEFGGQTKYFTDNGKAGGKSLITVLETCISAARAVVIEKNGVEFESPNAAFDYTLTASKDGIRLTLVDVNGAKSRASKLTETQKRELGCNENHFIAFKLIASRAFEAVECDKAYVNIANGEGGLKYADVIVPIGTDRGTFEITIKGGDFLFTLTVDLGNLDAALPAATAEIIKDEYTLDQGGIYTVRYSGLTNPTSVKFILLGNQLDYATVNGGLDPQKGYEILPGSIAIMALRAGNGTLEVDYKVPAANLQNLISDQYLQNKVGVIEGTETINFTLVSSLKMSDKAFDIGDKTYVFSADDKLIVIAMTDSSDVRDGNLELNATLNIQNNLALSRNVGLKINGGAAVATDDNVLTLDSRTEKRLIVVNGAVNNNGDYDRGAILMMIIHLPAVEIRKSDVAEPYYFTANENTVNGQSEYTIYKVDGNTITAETVKAEGVRTTRSPLDCVTDGVDSLEYKVSETVTFYYGALVVPASGAHTWEAVAGSNTMDECKVCHYTRELKDGKYYILRIATAFENEDLSGDWWDGTTGATKVSGDFILEYTYDLVRDSWKDMVVQMTDGTNWGTFEVFGTNAAWAADPITANLTIAKVELNGTPITDDSGAPKLQDPTSWIGSHKLTFTRIGTTMTIVADYTGMNATATTDTVDENGKAILTGLKFPFTGESGEHYVVTYVIENCTTEGLTIQLAGNPHWADHMAKRTGEVQAYGGTVVIGGKNYDLGFLPAFAVKNTDLSGDWWDGSIANVTTHEGNFAARYTWTNERDPLWHQDVVIEVIVGRTKYLDINFATNNPWGGGWIDAGYSTNSMTATKNGTDITDSFGSEFTQGDGLNGEERWKGEYTLTIVRVDNTFVIEQKIVNTAGVTYVVTNVITIADEIAETNAIVQLVGNPFWVDNITAAYGYATLATR